MNESQPDRPSPSRCSSPSCGCGHAPLVPPAGAAAPAPLPNRRDLLKWSGLAAVAAWAPGSPPGGLPALAAGPFTPADTADHFVPADKKLRPEWLKALFERGEPQWYAGADLRMIGMPVGGIAAGQVYVGGDGSLLYWEVFNRTDFTGYGDKNYSAGPPAAPIRQGFTVRVRRDGAEAEERPLTRAGFPGVRFRGEYPIALVEYPDDAFPVAVSLEAFSPFCPLAEEDSSLPATVLRYTLKNKTDKPLEVTLAGVLENAVGRFSQVAHRGVRVNTVVREGPVTMVAMGAKAAADPAPARPNIVIETFEGPTYGTWTAEGEAFGAGPAKGTINKQQPVSGFQGKGLVNTFLNGSDRAHGKLTSPPFKIERNFLCFLIGGGSHAGKTCVNLLVDGKAVRTMTGRDNEKLEARFWDVRDLAGKEARLEIVDAESGPWGHVNVDQVELRDVPRSEFAGPFEKQSDFGTMALAVLDDPAGTGDAAAPAAGAKGEHAARPGAEAPLAEKIGGAVSVTVRLEAGQTQVRTFAVAWHFPNRDKRGNRYAQRFADAPAVVRYVAKEFDRLYGQTKLWHRTWYEDSTLPRWLLDRLFSTVSTLATGTCQWWANGRFWAWEGVGCCHGTCAHVWNYEHAMARLFPALERSVRAMQDLEPGAGFDEKTGAVRFRGEGWANWAGDSQGGTALKCLREHQAGADSGFLKQYWPRIRKTIQFLIEQDAHGDGLIEGKQHNTYDIDFYGANTMVGSLYLGALRAGEEMAGEVGDAEFAATCRRILQAGSKNTIARLWNGEYFVQQVDLAQHPKHQYAQGCLADQLFGQGWAHQLALGYVYPRANVLSALKAIWTYNWAPDVGPQNAKHPPQRWFARPGEAGLFTCTWPRSKHLGKDSVLYRDEVWTGIEYQVAGHMVWEGMLTEALALCRAVHDRYHPARHNPWNEIECGDHYARGMASYGVFLALCGYECHGPRAHLGFDPRITPEKFSAAFTAPQGWGTYGQQLDDGALRAELAVHWGTLSLRTLALNPSSRFQPGRIEAAVGEKSVPVALDPAVPANGQAGEGAGQRMSRIRFDPVIRITAGEKLTVILHKQ